MGRFATIFGGEMKRFFDKFIDGMVAGVIVAAVVAALSVLWWLDHVRFVF